MNLREKYYAIIKDLSVINDYPFEDKDFYAAWLSQTHYYSAQTLHILLMGAAHCDRNQTPLQYRLSKHAGEERGHEILAVRDLQDMGYTPEHFGESAITAAFYQMQVYKIQNLSVEPLMGFILPLEGLAVEFGRALRDRVAKAKLPTRFLDIHVDEDPDHVEKGFAAAEKMSPPLLQEAIKNMEHTRDLYIGILDECKRLAAVKGHGKSKKAS